MPPLWRANLSLKHVCVSLWPLVHPLWHVDVLPTFIPERISYLEGCVIRMQRVDGAMLLVSALV